jgi:hypothetical protein
LWDDMWLDRRRVLREVLQSLDHFPDKKSKKMSQPAQTISKGLTSRSSWHPCILSVRHQAGRTRPHRCCNHPDQSQCLKWENFNTINFCTERRHTLFLNNGSNRSSRKTDWRSEHIKVMIERRDISQFALCQIRMEIFEMSFCELVELDLRPNFILKKS